jgi:hypothetical protein
MVLRKLFDEGGWQSVPKGGNSSARTLAAYLARAEGGISIARMARFFGREESTLVRANRDASG